MPQMAPLLWLILFFYFIMLFIFYIVNFYFMSLPQPPSLGLNMKFSFNKFNWLW